MFTREELEAFKRPELQKLAKEHGIRANSKSSVIIDELLAALGAQASAVEVEKEDEAPAEADMVGEEFAEALPETAMAVSPVVEAEAPGETMAVDVDVFLGKSVVTDGSSSNDSTLVDEKEGGISPTASAGSSVQDSVMFPVEAPPLTTMLDLKSPHLNKLPSRVFNPTASTRKMALCDDSLTADLAALDDVSVFDPEESMVRPVSQASLPTKEKVEVIRKRMSQGTANRRQSLLRRLSTAPLPAMEVDEAPAPSPDIVDQAAVLEAEFANVSTAWEAVKRRSSVGVGRRQSLSADAALAPVQETAGAVLAADVALLAAVQAEMQERLQKKKEEEETAENDEASDDEPDDEPVSRKDQIKSKRAKTVQAQRKQVTEQRKAEIKKAIANPKIAKRMVPSASSTPAANTGAAASIKDKFDRQHQKLFAKSESIVDTYQRMQQSRTPSKPVLSKTPSKTPTQSSSAPSTKTATGIKTPATAKTATTAAGASNTARTPKNLAGVGSRLFAETASTRAKVITTTTTTTTTTTPARPASELTLFKSKTARPRVKSIGVPRPTPTAGVVRPPLQTSKTTNSNAPVSLIPVPSSALKENRAANSDLKSTGAAKIPIKKATARSATSDAARNEKRANALKQQTDRRKAALSNRRGGTAEIEA